MNNFLSVSFKLIVSSIICFQFSLFAEILPPCGKGTHWSGSGGATYPCTNTPSGKGTHWGGSGGPDSPKIPLSDEKKLMRSYYLKQTTIKIDDEKFIPTMALPKILSEATLYFPFLEKINVFVKTLTPELMSDEIKATILSLTHLKEINFTIWVSQDHIYSDIDAWLAIEIDNLQQYTETILTIDYTEIDNYL